MLISSLSNQRSAMPSGLDHFAGYADGTGIASVLDAEIWNRIETALVRTQAHAQSLLHVASRQVNSNLFRVALRKTVTVGSPTLLPATDFTLTAAQLAFLSNAPFRWCNSLYADAEAVTGSAVALITSLQPMSGGVVRVFWRNADNTTNVAAGDYRVSLTTIGI